MAAARKASLLADAARNAASSRKTPVAVYLTEQLWRRNATKNIGDSVAQAEIEGIMMVMPQTKPVETIA